MTLTAHYGYIKEIESLGISKDTLILKITSLNSKKKYLSKTNSRMMDVREMKKGTLIIFLLISTTILDAEPVKRVQKGKYYK